jgi:hypothetical protein
MRKIIERVFGMLKKRFRILRLPMLVKKMSEVEDIVKVCCAVDFKEECIMYTVRHLTDNFTHEPHISDFVAMADGSYPRTKDIAKADALAHKMWVSFMEDF